MVTSRADEASTRLGSVAVDQMDVFTVNKTLLAAHTRFNTVCVLVSVCVSEKVYKSLLSCICVHVCEEVSSLFELFFDTI